MIKLILVLIPIIGILSTSLVNYQQVYADHYLRDTLSSIADKLGFNSESNFDNNLKDIEQNNEKGDNIINIENHQDYDYENRDYEGYNYRDSYDDDDEHYSNDYLVKVTIKTFKQYDHIPDLKLKVKDQTKSIDSNDEFGNNKVIKVFKFSNDEIKDGQKFKACLKATEQNFDDINVCHNIKRSGESDKTVFELY